MLCQYESCTVKARARGFCAKHYRVIRNQGGFSDLSSCSVEGCGGSVYAKGYCETHYTSYRRYGNPLVRKRVRRGQGTTTSQGYRVRVQEGRHILEHREVMEAHLGRCLKASEWVVHVNGDRADNRLENLRVVVKGGGGRDLRGYWMVYRQGKKVPYHRLLVEERLGRPLLPHETVHHINGVRDDNRLENLELWSSSQPAGQRVTDKVHWARHIISLYGGYVDDTTGTTSSG